MSEEYFIRSYDRFRPLVQDIKSKDTTAKYIDSGAESSVWKVTVNGVEYAIKLFDEYSPRGRKKNVQLATEGTIKAGIRGLGIPGLEQLCAASVEDGVIICKFISGSNLRGITDMNSLGITPEHIARLQETILLGTNAGIEFDGWNNEGDNAFFSTKEGFTLIDYWASDYIDYENNRKFVLKSLGNIGLQLMDRI